MNGYERMMLTLSGEKADYTPSMEIMIDQKVMAQTGYRDYMDFCEFAELDAVITNTPSSLYRNEVIDPQKNIFRNEWGTVRRQGSEVVSAIVGYPIGEITEAFHYKAPDPGDEYRFYNLRELVKRFKHRKLVGMHIHDAFNYPYYLAGMEALFVGMYEEPEAVRKLVDISVEHNIALAQKAVALGADFILLGDDYGGGNQLLVSPEKFREFFLPGLQKVVSAVRDMGVFCFKHCCGNINAILDDVVATGIHALHPLDPSAGMDILKTKETYPNLVVMGGVNCYEPLCEYSVEALEAETRRVIKTVGRGGRFVIASSNSIHSDVKAENYMAMLRVRKELAVE
jgi:uroporphyrinogen decarboxylase